MKVISIIDIEWITQLLHTNKYTELWSSVLSLTSPYAIRADEDTSFVRRRRI